MPLFNFPSSERELEGTMVTKAKHLEELGHHDVEPPKIAVKMAKSFLRAALIHGHQTAKQAI